MLHERPSVKAIPQDEKENVLFMLGNENNATRQAYGQRPCYADDCRAWSYGSSKSKRQLAVDSYMFAEHFLPEEIITCKSIRSINMIHYSSNFVKTCGIYLIFVVSYTHLSISCDI
jgi:hypothetical protein